MKPHACHNSWGLKHGTSHMGDTASYEIKNFNNYYYYNNNVVPFENFKILYYSLYKKIKINN